MEKVILPQIKSLIGWIIGVGTIIIGLMAGYQQSIVSDLQHRQSESDSKIMGMVNEIVKAQREVDTRQDQQSQAALDKLQTVALLLNKASTRLDMIDERGTRHEVEQVEHNGKR